MDRRKTLVDRGLFEAIIIGNMDFYELGGYQKLAGALEQNRRLNSNLLIVSLPGIGASFYLKKYIEKMGGDGLTYIVGPGEKTAKFNILDLDFDMNESALDWVDQYLKEAGTEEKFAVVINTPGIIKRGAFGNSYLGRHVYATHFLGVEENEMVSEMAGRLGVNINVDQESKIWNLTGGIGRWVKYFLGHIDEIEKTADDLLGNSELVRIIEPTAKAVRDCDGELLGKLGIIKDGKVRSALLEEYLASNRNDEGIDLRIESDLTLDEDGNAGSKLLKVEADVVKYMLEHEFVIEKERIADIKWGEGTYDKFSDQAINKSMRRLDKKLKKYKIETISGFGFKLVKR